jgi:hypothetical protein
MNAPLLVLSKRRRWVVVAAGLLVLVGVSVFTLRIAAARCPTPPKAALKAKRGEFVEKRAGSRELKAQINVLTAPSGAGDIKSSAS